MKRPSLARLCAWFLGCAPMAVACEATPPASTPRGAPSNAIAPAEEWRAYGHDPGGTRYAPIAQIDRTNVTQLKVAWTYHTGDMARAEQRVGLSETAGGNAESPKIEFEATPIVVDGTLYFATPFSRVIALDAATGVEKWTFDPHIEIHRPKANEPLVSRGVSTWLDTQAPEGAPCRRRILFGTYDVRLLVLDAATGRPCESFGTHGEVDLKNGLGEIRHGEVTISSPPAIFRDLVIVGSAIGDNNRVDQPSGMVRAFDARSGALRWSWDPIPRKASDPARSTWAGDSSARTGAANVWSIMSVDEARDLVFLPTTSPSPDYFGGERGGDNLHANSVVALRASTGERVWSFQTVHHDVWDYDNPSEPVLLDVKRDGRTVAAVAQGTKMGRLFLFERESGKPLFPIEERPVPTDGAPGEALSRTQPMPTLPPPLVPQALTADDAWGLTDADREWCKQKLRALRTGGIFTPPSTTGTVMYPGNIGGMHWGGGSFDPERGLYITNTNRMAFVVQLIARDDYARAAAQAPPGTENGPQSGTPFGMSRGPLFNPRGMVPCTAPPWGTLVAVEVATGKVRWEVPLGFLPWLDKEPRSRAWGSINLGGSIVTAGGLVFIAATVDGHLRAFDVDTGAEVWKAPLPAAAKATPMTYRAGPNGKQFVVIAAGGFAGLTKPSDSLVAFALPAASSEVDAGAECPTGKGWRVDGGFGRCGLDLSLVGADGGRGGEK